MQILELLFLINGLKKCKWTSLCTWYVIFALFTHIFYISKTDKILPFFSQFSCKFLQHFWGNRFTCMMFALTNADDETRTLPIVKYICMIFIDDSSEKTQTDLNVANFSCFTRPWTQIDIRINIPGRFRKIHVCLYSLTLILGTPSNWNIFCCIIAKVHRLLCMYIIQFQEIISMRCYMYDNVYKFICFLITDRAWASRSLLVQKCFWKTTVLLPRHICIW